MEKTEVHNGDRFRSIAMPAGAEEFGVGVTVGSGHERDRDHDKTVITK
jgi:hypothetical protein